MTFQQECEARIKEKMDAGMTRERAAKAVFAEDPELREAMIQESNPHRRDLQR